MADNKNTPKPKPVSRNAQGKIANLDTEAPVVYDAIVSEEVAEVEAEAPVEVEVEVIEEVDGEGTAFIVATEDPAITKYTEKSAAPATTYAVVSNDEVDTVFASKIVAHNKMNKKSLSVHHLQRRLGEWGYVDAILDIDGYCGDKTISAISAFQEDQGLEVTGVANYTTLLRIFEGDTNVRVAN